MRGMFFSPPYPWSGGLIFCSMKGWRERLNDIFGNWKWELTGNRFISHLQSVGYMKEKEITFPHKQSAFMKLRRENFEAPAL